MVPALPRCDPARLGALRLWRPSFAQVRLPLSHLACSAAATLLCAASLCSYGGIMWLRRHFSHHLQPGIYQPVEWRAERHSESCICRDLVRSVINSETGILLTTYEHLRLQHAELLDVRCGTRGAKPIPSFILTPLALGSCLLHLPCPQARCLIGMQQPVLAVVYPPQPKNPRSHACSNCRWGYVVLDEGHRIRNPDAEVTLMAKQLQTVHRSACTPDAC